MKSFIFPKDLGDLLTNIIHKFEILNSVLAEKLQTDNQNLSEKLQAGNKKFAEVSRLCNHTLWSL
jgi:hypothetical protein